MATDNSNAFPQDPLCAELLASQARLAAVNEDADGRKVIPAPEYDRPYPGPFNCLRWPVSCTPSAYVIEGEYSDGTITYLPIIDGRANYLERPTKAEALAVIEAELSPNRR